MGGGVQISIYYIRAHNKFLKKYDIFISQPHESLYVMCVYVLISQYLQSLKDEKETKLANRKERKKMLEVFFFD